MEDAEDLTGRLVLEVVNVINEMVGEQANKWNIYMYHMQNIALSYDDRNLGSCKETQASPAPNWLDGLPRRALHWYCHQ